MTELHVEKAPKSARITSCLGAAVYKTAERNGSSLDASVTSPWFRSALAEDCRPCIRMMARGTGDLGCFGGRVRDH